jgi:preprotein translocase subunit SecG
MYQMLLVVHVLVALALIGLVLIQHGKGADIGAGFGSGASNTVFGSQGTGRFLFKMTGGLALTFFVTSVLLSSLVASNYQTVTQSLLPITAPVTESSMPMPLESSPGDESPKK